MEGYNFFQIRKTSKYKILPCMDKMGRSSRPERGVQTCQPERTAHRDILIIIVFRILLF